MTPTPAEMPDFEPADETPPRRDRPAAGRDRDAPQPPVDADPEPTPRRARRWRAILDRARHPAVAFVAGLAVAALAMAGVPAIERAAEAGTIVELERVVEEYAQAVEQGDASAATAMLALDEDRADASLVEAGAEPRDLPTIDCVVPEVVGDVASVPCAVDVPVWGTETATLRVERTEGRWALVEGLAVVGLLSVPIASVESIGGAPVDAAIASGERELWLYPGRYDLGVSVPGSVELGTGLSLAAVPTGTFTIGSPQPTGALREDSVAAAVAYVEACANQPAAGCPSVPPLAAGESFAGLTDFLNAGAAGQDALSLSVDVRRVGATVDRYAIQVTVQYADDLASYEIVPAFRG